MLIDRPTAIIPACDCRCLCAQVPPAAVLTEDESAPLTPASASSPALLVSAAERALRHVSRLVVRVHVTGSLAVGGGATGMRSVARDVLGALAIMAAEPVALPVLEQLVCVRVRVACD